MHEAAQGIDFLNGPGFSTETHAARHIAGVRRLRQGGRVRPGQLLSYRVSNSGAMTPAYAAPESIAARPTTIGSV